MLFDKACLFQMLATGMRSVLLDMCRIENLVGSKLDENIQEYIKMLAECTYHVLTASSYGNTYIIVKIWCWRIVLNQHFYLYICSLFQNFNLKFVYDKIITLQNDFWQYVEVKKVTMWVWWWWDYFSIGKGSGTPRIAGMFMKANRNWLREQVDTITEHMVNG